MAGDQSSDNPGVLVEDANALALQYDIVPTERRASVLAALKTLWTPYGAILGPGLQDPTGHVVEPFGNGMRTAGPRPPPCNSPSRSSA